MCLSDWGVCHSCVVRVEEVDAYCARAQEHGPSPARNLRREPIRGRGPGGPFVDPLPVGRVQTAERAVRDFPGWQLCHAENLRRIFANSESENR